MAPQGRAEATDDATGRGAPAASEGADRATAREPGGDGGQGADRATAREPGGDGGQGGAAPKVQPPSS
jgi:hypothetical protein